MSDPKTGVVRRYSKPSGFYFEARREFFAENDALRAKALEANTIYARQPARTTCKLCSEPLPPDDGFVSHGVPYVRCSRCTHLNGRHEDGAAFWAEMYVSETRDYAQLYVGTAFEDRVRDIYLPKVDFLIDALPDGSTLSLLDIGCGAGFFVDAALKRGVGARGIDVNAAMVQFGNDAIEQQSGLRPLALVDGSSFAEEMEQSDEQVLSAIGVIEHVSDLEAFWRAFRASSFEFLYFSVPMFSLTSVVEHAFPDVAPRHLQGEHTHLFTEESLHHMYGLLGVEPVAEWRFGTDVMDLFRSQMHAVEGSGANLLRDELASRFVPVIDELQAILDRAHYCSEIHVLAQRT